MSEFFNKQKLIKPDRQEIIVFYKLILKDNKLRKHDIKEKLRIQMMFKNNNITEDSIKEEVPYFRNYNELILSLSTMDRSIEQIVKFFSFFSTFYSLRSIFTNSKISQNFFYNFIRKMKIEYIF